VQIAEIEAKLIAWHRGHIWIPDSRPSLRFGLAPQ
jgi:hypothetical protein